MMWPRLVRLVSEAAKLHILPSLLQSGLCGFQCVCSKRAQVGGYTRLPENKLQPLLQAVANKALFSCAESHLVALRGRWSGKMIVERVYRTA
eukprot:1716009-Amphidinium_carterae.1